MTPKPPKIEKCRFCARDFTVEFKDQEYCKKCLLFGIRPGEREEYENQREI